jgi:transposase
MEATGVYHEELAYYLVAQGHTVSIIMPKKIKAYAASLDIKSKTDDWDAQVLTRFGLERPLLAWTPPSESMRALRALTREHQSLNGLSTQVRNQLHALSRAHHAAATTEKRLKALLQLYAKQQKRIEQEMHALGRSRSRLEISRGQCGHAGRRGVYDGGASGRRDLGL